MCVVMAITLLITRKKQLVFIILTSVGYALPSTALPLSNTLFTIHPIFLIIGVVQCITNISHRKKSMWLGIVITGLAIFGGGF